MLWAMEDQFTTKIAYPYNMAKWKPPDRAALLTAASN